MYETEDKEEREREKEENKRDEIKIKKKKNFLFQSIINMYPIIKIPSPKNNNTWNKEKSFVHFKEENLYL